jgi:hypothetical protein
MHPNVQTYKTLALQGFTLEEIAQQTGFCVRAVRRSLQRHQVPYFTRQVLERRQLNRVMQHLADAGFSQSQVAQLVGLDRATVHRHVRRGEIAFPDYQPWRRNTKGRILPQPTPRPEAVLTPQEFEDYKLFLAKKLTKAEALAILLARRERRAA